MLTVFVDWRVRLAGQRRSLERRGRHQGCRCGVSVWAHRGGRCRSWYDGRRSHFLGAFPLFFILVAVAVVTSWFRVLRQGRHETSKTQRA
eukprot:815430-Prorocentrum_lima.AAC.1